MVEERKIVESFYLFGVLDGAHDSKSKTSLQTKKIHCMCLNSSF